MKNPNSNTLIFYCSWGVIDTPSGYLIDPLHNLYITEAKKHFDKVVLVSNATVGDTEDKVAISSDVEVFTLPVFSSYLSAIRKVGGFNRVIRDVSYKYPGSRYYLRSPEPFSWLFHFYNKKKSKLIYHFMSNPLEAILNRKHSALISRCIKYCMYMPELMFTTYIAKKNHVSCNGELLKRNLSNYLPKNTVILNESTLRCEDFVSEMSINKRDSSEPINMLYVGYLREAKGVDNLIDALVLLHDAGVDFIFNIVGSGPMENLLRSTVTSKGMGEKIKFLGYISDRDNLLDIYSASHLFVFPSLSEGSPRVVIEAMSRGVAVIATDVGNTRELLKGNGLCIKPNDVNAILDAMIFYSKHESNRYSDARKALEHSRNLTIENFFINFKKI
ncbi:glycosyltransferase family 4 protein [Vibrio cyclitrophicus]